MGRGGGKLLDAERTSYGATLQVPSPVPPSGRRQSTSVLTCRDETGPDVVSTSFGPVRVDVSVTAGQIGPGRICLGVCLALLSGCLYTLTNFLFQLLELHPTEALCVRSLLQIVLMAALLPRSCCNRSHRPFFPGPCSSRTYLTLQGLFSGARVLLALSSMLYIPLGDALTIIFTEPVWTLFLSWVFLRGQLSMRKLMFCLLLVGGTVLVVKPPGLFPAGQGAVLEQTAASGWTPSSALLLGAGLALGASVSGAAQNVLIAKLSAVSTPVHMVHSGLGGLVLGLAASLPDSTHRLTPALLPSVSLHDWLLLLALGFLGLAGFGCLTRALQLVPPTTVAVLRSMEILLAFGLQAAVTAILPDSLDLLGAALIILGVLATALEDTVPEWRPWAACPSRPALASCPASRPGTGIMPQVDTSGGMPAMTSP